MPEKLALVPGGMAAILTSREDGLWLSAQWPTCLCLDSLNSPEGLFGRYLSPTRYPVTKCMGEVYFSVYSQLFPHVSYTRHGKKY